MHIFCVLVGGHVHSQVFSLSFYCRMWMPTFTVVVVLVELEEMAYVSCFISLGKSTEFHRYSPVLQCDIVNLGTLERHDHHLPYLPVCRSRFRLRNFIAHLACPFSRWQERLQTKHHGPSSWACPKSILFTLLSNSGQRDLAPILCDRAVHGIAFQFCFLRSPVSNWFIAD